MCQEIQLHYSMDSNFHPVDSTIHILNNWDLDRMLVHRAINPFSTEYVSSAQF